MKFTTFSFLSACSLAANIQIINNKDVDLSLYHWVDGNRLFFKSRFTSKTVPLEEGVSFANYHLITENLTPEQAAEIDFQNRLDNELPFDFLDGPTFVYSSEIKSTSVTCQKEGDKEAQIGTDCPWIDEPRLWETDSDAFTAGASRSLDEYYELKLGSAQPHQDGI